ncbi:NUDIX hydrolase [Candidatus Falkowbacteria bacterium]|nr:NUDIX hydrolase [Candidatus Falkowbacteria bacterium]
MTNKKAFDFKKATEGWNLLVASEIVVFSLIKNKLNVLLVKRRFGPGVGKWAIPGGFVREDESLEEAALRELNEETGLSKSNYLEQLYTFGEVKRDPRTRVIAVAYMVLVSEPEKIKLSASDDAREARWFPITDLPELSFGKSHEEILLYAWQRLKWKFEYTNVAATMMQSEFTLTELQKAYEAVYKDKIDKRNFRKKILSLAMVEPLDKVTSEVGRPAQLYKATTKKLKIYSRVI